MSDDGFADDVYQGADDNPQLDTSDTLDDTDLSVDPLDTGYSPPDREPLNTRYGTTAREEFEGESLDQLLAEQEPDINADDDPDYAPAELRSGRLVAPDEGAHGDVESDAIAQDVGIDGGAASAEEAAMHVVDE